MTRPRRAAPPPRRRPLLDMTCAEALLCLAIGITLGCAVFWLLIRPLMQVQ